MTLDLAGIKAANPIAEVIGRDISLIKAGREFKALCPIHGEKTPSFTVMPDRGRFHCFGCGADGDVIDYVQISRKLDLQGACEFLGGAVDGHLMIRTAPSAAPKQNWQPVMPVPDDVPAPPSKHPHLGAPEHVARVLNQEGELLHLIYRFPPPPGGNKQVRPLCFDGNTWQWKGALDPRPLYGLPLTSGRPILLVEGEKKRDAADIALDGAMDVVSWQNGSDGVGHAAWHLLRDRDVTMWPDADGAGHKAAAAVADALRGVAGRFRLLTPPPAVPAGWDVANAILEGWTGQQILEFVSTAEEVRDPSLDPPEPDPNDPGFEPPPASEDPDSAPPRSRRRQDGQIAWGEPVDFMAEDQMGAPILAAHHIPDALWPFVKDNAELMGVDPTGLALGCIVCCASVIDEKWRIQPRRKNYLWTESARLWAGILGGPSTIKTPQVSACTKPLDKLEIAARIKHADEMRTYDAALAEHKRALKAKEQTEEPKRPKLQRFLAEDATIEALSEVLRDENDPRGKQYAPAGKVLVRQDEMAEFFAGQDRYKSGSSDRGAYLRLFNGARFTMDRVMRGTFSINSWSACFFGGCQPGPIQKIARDAADDGLLQRFLWCVPSRQDNGIDRAPDHEAMNRYDALFPALVAMHPAPEIGSTHVRPIAMHADGHVIREEVEAVARAVAAMPDTSPRLQSAFGKWPGIFARIVLTFHMINIADARARQKMGSHEEVVPVEVIERAASFMLEIVLPHQLRADALMYSTAQTNHAQWIAGLILSKKVERITTRDVTRNYGALRSPEAAQELVAVMSSLVAVGWLEPEESPNPAKPTHAWIVNPQVHILFSVRAERERCARQTAKETLLKDVEVLLKQRKARSKRP